MPPLIELSAIRFGGSTTTQRDFANITFLPPDPRTNIFSGGATSTVLEIDLHDLKSNYIKTVRVNFLGLAEVIN